MTVVEHMQKIMKPFEGASNCDENRRKLKIIIKNFLPDATEEDMDTAITGILESKHETYN